LVQLPFYFKIHGLKWTKTHLGETLGLPAESIREQSAAIGEQKVVQLRQSLPKSSHEPVGEPWG